MATILTTSEITTSANEENRTDYETDLSAENMDHHEMKNITCEPPMPKSICEEEMQGAHLDDSEVIIEYMANAHSNKIKKLKPIFIKYELDREYTHNIESDDDLPAVPEENFTQKREVTIDSYSDEYDLHGYYCSYTKTVTPSEEIFLDKFLMALHKVNPSLH